MRLASAPPTPSTQSAPTTPELTTPQPPRRFALAVVPEFVDRYPWCVALTILSVMSPSPDSNDLIAQLESMTEPDLDRLDFGVIGFDESERVRCYNRYEADTAGLTASRVIGRDLFVDVAPCTNNFLVAERFRQEPSLDEELDYVFTLRMKPTPVRLRLLADPSAALRYMIVVRTADDGQPAS